jgi:hypothetical protein
VEGGSRKGGWREGPREAGEGGVRASTLPTRKSRVQEVCRCLEFHFYELSTGGSALRLITCRAAVPRGGALKVEGGGEGR